MTHELSDREVPGGRSRRPGGSGPRIVAQPALRAQEAEPQAERSEEPFALLRAALERGDDPEAPPRSRG